MTTDDAPIDNYQFWTAALAAPHDIGKTPALKISIGEWQKLGFYRLRDGKRGAWQAVAIWRSANAQAIITCNGELQSEQWAADKWQWFCEHPISRALYLAAEQNEWRFPDDPAPAVIGHNLAGAEPIDIIRAELASDLEAAAKVLPKDVTTQDQADQVAAWARRATDLAKRADDRRVVEKQPHLDAGRAVDDLWRGVIAEAKQLAQDLRDHIEPFLIARKREDAERVAKAAAEAERLRAEARKAQDGQDRLAAIEAAQEAERQAKPRKASAGRTGAKLGLRSETRVRIVDRAQATAYFQDAPEMIELVDRLALRAVKAGATVPGVESSTEDKAA